MNLPFFIARRYLFSKKSHNIINIISAISTFTVAVVTAAMVIVISAFDGLEKTITDLYNAFDADIVISPAQGKTFKADSLFEQKLRTSPIVSDIGYALEESVFLRYGDKQTIATIKGVSNNYAKISGIDTLIVDGDYDLGNDTMAYATVGYGVGMKLGLAINDIFTPLNIYSVKRNSVNSANAIDAVASRAVMAIGIFSVQNQPEYDNKYVITPLWFAQELLSRERQYSTVELKLKPGINVRDAKTELEGLLGEGYIVKNRYQLHEVLYKVINSEKWAVFMILSLILLTAIFNIMGSLTMLIVEKQSDSETLKAMGADSSMLRTIFQTEAFLITLIGTLSGVGAGLLLCIGQIKFQWILMAGEGSMPYPLHIRWADVGIIALLVMFIGTFIGWLTTRRSIGS
ncbi:MAG: FtsX-like permease family protein [Sphingobacteriales bacterium JAD_PAG50586_3]|nr:MAG: FtsX-like permease family protein [Sphingobacteriales bacterium JAD_PAG50586_3]